MQRRLAALALCLLTVLAYSNSLRASFVLDSKVLILEDPRLKAASLDNVSLILHHSYWWPYSEGNLYRPVTTLSYLVNYSVLGNRDSPVGYHVVNLLLHLLNVLLLYRIGRKLLDAAYGSTPAFCIAALWALHPLSTEAVTNIVGRADLLAAAGTLGALLAHIRAGDARAADRWRWRLVEVLAASVAIFSKESGIAVIAVIVLYDLLVRRRKAMAELVLPWALVCVPLLIFVVQRSSVAPAILPAEPFVDNPIAGAPFISARLTALAVMGRYLWLAFWPTTLSSDYSFAQIPLASGTPADWSAWLTAVAAIGATVWLLIRGHRLAFFAAASALVVFVPASNLLFATGTIMAERLMYLPLAGLVGCIVMTAYVAADRIKSPGVALAAALTVVVALFGFRTWDRNRDWRDEVTLWTSAVAAAPDSFKAHKGLADALYDADPARQQLERIVAEADRSTEILDPLPNHSNVPAAYRRAAGFHIELGDRLEQDTSRAADVEASYRRAAALLERYIAIVQAMPAGALSTPGITPGPTAGASGSAPAGELADAYQLLSTPYLRLSDSTRAFGAARRAHELRPFEANAYRVMAAALIIGTRHDEAAVQLLTGFMVTGDTELRQATIDLYRSDAAATNCALKQGRDGVVLDPTCDRVKRDLCAASAEAARIQRQSNRADLAMQVETMAVQAYGCK